MKCHFLLKKPGLKLVRVNAEFDGRKIKSLKITGDFFMHPEEAIEALERELIGSEVDWTLREKISSILKRARAQTFGIDADAIYECILGCLG